MKKAIYVNGGLGRITAALPALKASNSLIITSGWGELFTLTDLYCIESESAMMHSMLDGLDIITPEPYHQAGYRSGKYNMVKAFHKDLGTKGEDYGLTPDVKTSAVMYDKLVSSGAADKKIITIQVRASGDLHNVRNMGKQSVINAVDAARELGHFPVIIGDENIGFELDCSIVRSTTLTEFVSLIGLSDMFVGGDSSGMHIAKALNIPGIIYLTSTAGHKYYPEHFTEFRHPDHKSTFEYPRLFSAEQAQSKKNDRAGVNRYDISKEEYLKTFESLGETNASTSDGGS